MTVHGNGDLPEGEGAGINVAECLLTLVLDNFLENADRLCIRNFDQEYLTNIVVKLRVRSLRRSRSFNSTFQPEK